MIRHLLTPSNHDDDPPEEPHFKDFGIGMFVLALTMGIIARSSSAGAKLVDKSTVMGRYSVNLLAIFTRFPYTVLVMLMGALIGMLHEFDEHIFGKTLGESLDHWSRVSPEVVLFTILPILLFESAFSADVHIFRHEAKQIFMLAGPGVITSTALTAAFSIYVFGYDWNWYTALMFGSMMSATDPVAVVALVKELGMNERIGTLIEGEGLMNDGSAIVLFNVFKTAITSSKELAAGTVVATAFRLSLGGPVVGIVIGALTSSFLASFTYNDLQSEVTLTVVCCYSCFLVAEGTELKVSGVLAVVFSGLYLSFYGRGNISVKVEHSLHAFWHMAEYIADTIIFFVAGVVMASKFFSKAISTRDWGNLFMLFITLQIVRALNVVMCWPILRQGYGVSWQEAVVLVAGGLRGAVGLCLGLVVEEIDDAFLDHDTKSKIMFHMSGVAFLSLIINGTFMAKLVQYLGLDRISKAESEMFDHSCIVIEKRLEKYVDEELKTDMFLCNADFGIVWRYIPVMSAQQYWDRISANKIVLGLKEKEIMRSVVPAFRRSKSMAAGTLRSGPSMTERALRRKMTTFEGGGSGGSMDVLGISRSASGFVFGGYASDEDSVNSDDDRRKSIMEMDWESFRKMASHLCRGARAGIDAMNEMNAAYEHIPHRLQRHWHKLHWEYFGHGHHNRGAILRGGAPPVSVIPADTPLRFQMKKSKSFSAKVAAKQSFSNPALKPLSSNIELQNKMAERDKLAAVLEKYDEEISASIAVAKQNQMDMRRKSYVNVSKYDEDSMEKARSRFMQAVRAQYQANHHLGRMRPSVLRTLRESADGQLDQPDVPLHDFESLENKLTMSPNLQKLARSFAEVPVVEQILKHWIYLHLAFSIELACEFVRAHQAVDIIDLLGEGIVAERLIAENNLQLSKVHDVLNSQLPVFPEITHALKTQTAARQLLMFHMREIDVLVEEGSITEKEYESMLHKTDEMLIKLHSHPLAERLPQMADMLVSSNFLRGVPMDEVEKLATNTHMFTEMFVEPGVKLFRKGETAVVGGPAMNRHGWFLLVRGLVRMSGEVDANEYYGGGDAADLFSLRPARSGDVHDEAESSDIIVRPGATFGLFEQVLGCPFAYDFDTISYCHVLYVDAAAILKEASKATGEAIFLALFKAMALPLVPGLLRLDNNRKDPLRLVTCRDRYNGWESTGFMVHASATEAEAKTRRRTCSEARKDDFRFLGLKSLDKAVFHRPIMEELASVLPLVNTTILPSSSAALSSSAPVTTARTSSVSSGLLAATESNLDVRSAGNFSDLGEGRKRTISSAVRWGGGSNHSSNFDRRNETSANSDLENSMMEDANDDGSLGKRPSFFIQRSTFALSQPVGHGPGGNHGHDDLHSAPQPEKKKDTVQWVIEVSANKTYLLVRGKIMGRASHSKETASALSMIEGVKTLAQNAGDQEHISDAELLVLQSLLHKLQRAPLSHHANKSSVRSISTPPASPNRHSLGCSDTGTPTGAALLMGDTDSCEKGFPKSPKAHTQAAINVKLEALDALEKNNDDTDSDSSNDGENAVSVRSSHDYFEPHSPPPPLVMASAASSLHVPKLKRDNSDIIKEALGSTPVTRFIRMASELNLTDVDGDNGSQTPEFDEEVSEMIAPCVLTAGLVGRLQVTARTVIMEVPQEFKAASAALKMLTKLRRRQQKGDLDSFVESNSENESSDEESKSGDLVSDLVLEMLSTMRANKRGVSVEGSEEQKTDADSAIEGMNMITGASSPSLSSKSSGGASSLSDIAEGPSPSHAKHTKHSVGFNIPDPPAPKLKKKQDLISIFN